MGPSLSLISLNRVCGGSDFIAGIFDSILGDICGSDGGNDGDSDGNNPQLKQQ